MYAATAKSGRNRVNAMTDEKKPLTAKTDAPKQASTPAADKAPAAKSESVETSASKAPSKTPSKTVAKTVTKKAANKKAAKKADKKASAPAKARKTQSHAAKPKTRKAAANNKGNTMNDTIEDMTTASNEALKDGFEKSLKSVTEVSNFQKQTVDALIESATVTGKSLEAVNANAVAYAKSAMEEGVNASKAMASAKSVQEIYEIQSDYTKSAMDQYLAELNKTSDLVSNMFKNSMKPLNERMTAAVELTQTQR